jgi:hypothetical protein
MSSRAPLRLKTYSHLAPAGRMPSEYELVSTGLLYHRDGALELELPTAAWCRAQGAALACRRWAEFRDPRETTYAKYTALQAQNANQLEGLLHMIEETALDRRLPPAWAEVLGHVLGPARFLWHAFQMMAAYVGHRAPEGRIAIAHLMQAADEMRRVQVVAYRLGLLRRTRPGFAGDGRALWQSHAAWQPLRQAAERALCAWDFGEALVALNVCLKPLADVVLLEVVAEVAAAHGDHPLATALYSLNQDARWQREVTGSLLALVLGDRPEDREVVGRWVRTWLPRALEGASALGPLLGAAGTALAPRLREWAARWLTGLGLEPF